METRKLAGTEVDECPRCRGVWFDRGELESAKDQVDPDLQWMDLESWKPEEDFHVETSSLECPRCGHGMAGIEHRGAKVQIFHCGGCEGVWLDGGTFPRIIQAMEREIQTKPLSDYAKASLLEAKEILTGEEGPVSGWRDLRVLLRLLEYRFLADIPKLHNWLAEFQRANPIR
jgi:Zn-finger nucleic acid-binding protein